MATTIGNVYIRIGADTKALTRDLQAAQRQIRAAGKQFKEAGASLSQNLTLPLLAAGGAAVKAFSDLEALQKGLIAVMGSSEAAAREFEKLKDVAKLPGLGLEEAVKGSVSLQSAGFSADQARESLLQFGNALATVGKGKNELNLVVLALTQLQNKTSGFGQDLRQLVEQLPQLRGALTSAFGTADSEAIAKLGVTGKEVVQLLTQEFAKLPRVSGGVKNAFENLSDSTKVAFAKLGETLNKTLNIEGFLNKLGDTISKLTDKFNSLSPTTQKLIITFAGIAAAIGPVLFIGGQLASSFSAIIAAMRVVGITATVSLGPVGLVVAGIAAAVAILVIKWDDIKETMNQVGFSAADFTKLWNGLTTAIKLSLIPIKAAIDYLGYFVGTLVRLGGFLNGKISFSEFATTTLDSFKQIGTNAAESFTSAFNDGVKKVSLNIAGSTSGTDRLAGYAKLRQGSSSSVTPKAKGNGKKGDQFSPAITGGTLIEGIGVTGINGESPLIQTLNLIPSAIKSTDDLKFKMLELGRSMNAAFVTPLTAVEQMQAKFEGLARKISEIANVAGQIFSSAFGTVNTLLDNQGLKIDQNREKERQAVISSITNEDEKAKRLAAIDAKYDAEKRKLQRKQAIANKAAGIFDATIAAAQAVANALKLGPVGIPLAIVMGALGAAQIAAIAATPLPSLAIGTNRVKSDGLANIHKGEAIVPAKVASGGFTGGGNFIDRLEAFIEGHAMRVTQRNSEFLSSRLAAF